MKRRGVSLVESMLAIMLLGSVAFPLFDLARPTRDGSREAADLLVLLERLETVEAIDGKRTVEEGRRALVLQVAAAEDDGSFAPRLRKEAR